MKSDIQIVQEQFPAGKIIKIKGGDMLFMLLSIDWLNNKIEYRRSSNYDYDGRLKGIIDDMQMSDDVTIAWRNVKIDKLVK